MTYSVAVLDNVAPPELPPQVAYQRGAYAITRDPQGRVLIVQTETGRFYLPGGRIEAGESAYEALAREIIEECGWQAEVGKLICSAEQPIFGGTVGLSASYWEARLTVPAHHEPEHRLSWLQPAEAGARLHRASGRRALRLRQR